MSGVMGRDDAVAVADEKKVSIEEGGWKGVIVAAAAADDPTFGWGEGSRKERFAGHVGRPGRRWRSVVGAGGRVGWRMALSHGQGIEREGFGDEAVVGGDKRLEETSFGMVDVATLTAGLCSSLLTMEGEVIG